MPTAHVDASIPAGNRLVSFRKQHVWLRKIEFGKKGGYVWNMEGARKAYILTREKVKKTLWHRDVPVFPSQIRICATLKRHK
jgi:hypothetical protein